MNFGDELNNYINILECTTHDICDKSGLSYSLVNRYINNKRTPKKDSEYFNKLVDALYEIAVEKNIDLSIETISDTLSHAIVSSNYSVDYDLFVENFNKLQEDLNLSTVEISKAIGYDSSFISRIKNKERRPSDIENFINKLRIYISSQNEDKKANLAIVLNCSPDDIQDNDNFRTMFSDWICSKHFDSTSDNVFNFLSSMDNFNLNDYIGTDFSKIKVPTAPVILKNSKMYFGLEGRKQSEAEFLKITLISKSNEPIFYYNDLPITNAGNDENFKNKWIFVMSRVLKKGLHLNMIHNLDRPLNELFMGLEGWIPMYMSGSISPYYFQTTPSNFFSCSHCTSGSVALTSECLKGNEKKSKFYLTTKKEELAYEKEKSKYLISKATPLMDIYRENDKDKFDEFLNNQDNKDIQKIQKDCFKNIDFMVNNDKWVMINKKTSPEIHFVIYHEKLINAIKTFLLS